MTLYHIKTSSSNLVYLTRKGRKLIATTATTTIEETNISSETFIWHKMQEILKILVFIHQNPSFSILLHYATNMSMVQPSMYVNEKIHYVTNVKYQVTLLLSAFLIHHFLELSQHI